METQPVLQPLVTLFVAFLGPWFAYRLSRKEQAKRDALNRQIEKTRLTLSMLASYDDPEFSNRRRTLAEFQRDWDQDKEKIVDIIFPPNHQTVAAFFAHKPDSEQALIQHQNVNRFLAYISILVAYHDRDLIDPELLRIFAPRYSAYRPFLNNLKIAVYQRCDSGNIRLPHWCRALAEIEKILKLPRL